MGSDPPSGPSIIEQRIDCNRLGALGSQLHIYTQQKFTHVPPLGCLAAVTTEITAAKETRGAFHLVKNSENSGSGLNGKRFFGSPDRKIPRKSGTTGAFSIYQKIPENSRNFVGKCLSVKDVFHLTNSSHSSQAPFTVRCISRQNTKWRHNCYCLTNARLLFRRSGSLKFR